MLFNDPWFLFVYLPLTVVMAVVIRRFAGARAVLGALVLASVFFYAWWNPIYLPVLGVIAGVTYAVGQRILKARQQGRTRAVNALLLFGICFCLAALGYFKYTDFLIGTTNGLFGTHIPYQHIVLPLGISFFTFQKIAYLVDASRGQMEKHDFLEYCFFIMFFPQLIAGPIVHHHEIFSQTHGRHAFSARAPNLIIGASIFLIGLFKKVVVADNLSLVVAQVFGSAEAGEHLYFADAWIGAGAYAFQLYFDFSGYSDMAIGSARMFGIRLPLNFESPYQSTGIIEFWRRWHMTLSRFLRDYLYIPLGGSRRGKFRRYLNLMITMTIGGLWHGASWNFVLWGFLHGLFLIINHAWRAVWTPINTWWSRAISRSVTMAAVIIAFVPFRAPTMDGALNMFRGMVNLPADAKAAFGPLAGALEAVGVRFQGRELFPEDWVLLAWAIVAVAVVWYAPNTQQIMAWFRPAYGYDRDTLREDPPLLDAVMSTRWMRWRPRLGSALVVGTAAALAGLSLSRVSEFLYFAF